MDSLRDVVQQLDSARVSSPTTFSGWQIEPINGGANNLLYHIRGDADYVVKFTIKDDRRRAEREFNALNVLHLLGLDLAPHPILLDMEHYSQPVIVQTWLHGEVRPEPPQTDDEWLMLIHYLTTVHSVTSEKIASNSATCQISLYKPVSSAESAEQGLQIIRAQLERLPLQAQPQALQQAIAHFEALPVPKWDAPSLTLVRADPNPRNFIRGGNTIGQWSSVDWEYSGISDPAFEIADMIAHAAYLDVNPERWEWVIDQYCTLNGNRTCEMRIRTYWRTLLVWWLVRLARYLYEIPRGLDPRLVDRPANWKESTEQKYVHYLNQIDKMLSANHPN